MGQALAFYQTLYRQFDQERTARGDKQKIIVQVGSATCENAAGADQVRQEFDKLIRASGRQDILLKQTGCTGRCAREPIVGVFFPGQIPIKYEQVTPNKVQEIFQHHVIGGKPIPNLILDKKTDTLYSYVVTMCSSHRCSHENAQDSEEMLKRLLRSHNIAEDLVRIFHSGCLGLCPKEKVGKQHVMMVFPERTLYRFETEEDLDEIVKSHFVDHQVNVKHRYHTDFITEQFFSMYGDVAFFNKQTRLTLRNSGLIDPESLPEYVLNKGYEALAQVLETNDPDAVRQTILKSGLRGRGGGGFPTGQKWINAVTYTDDPIRYVVCNADEGDPGAFMDRSALEGDPFIVLEGMTIGAVAVGARQGYIYIRAEYPLAIERLEKAIATAHKHRLLGKNILDSGLNFDIEIRLGAGAFVCGEETALIYSIEGKRGQPRIRPPYPTQSGLWGHPTVINNVETWANVPTIMLYGADWFSRIGTKNSRGTKVFALAGKVLNTGLVEVPMGTRLRDIIFDIGGGLREGHTLKAVQTGGPSGGCIPADRLDTMVEYETLSEIGSIMGSGGMIVLDDEDCMVATSKFFLEFTQSESCGKCVPCREGTLRMLEILERITQGKGEMADLDKLRRLGKLIQKTSLCGLGQTAPNPVLSALENFTEEFIIHIRDKRCPAHKCTQLIRYEIDIDKCTGCTLCARRCPVSCIAGAARQPHVIDQSRCIKCSECYNVCKFDAVRRT
ncbi:MAG TPA: NADH-ubiquinone oxidoreductase-F iron-sulfur binding region domain-containing protein [bacterium]|nr:NADH-ubiquinone oxidoreductase-F iron-sulfur binding region domain-containing protein [bacterium]